MYGYNRLFGRATLVDDGDNDNNEIAILVSKLIPISCVFMMGDAIQATIGGVLRGLGKQKVVLILNILGFWILAVPIGSILTFVVDKKRDPRTTTTISVDGNDNDDDDELLFGVKGLWWGMVIGIYSSAIIGIFIIKFRVNWYNEVEKSIKRLSTTMMSSSSSKRRNSVSVRDDVQQQEPEEHGREK